MPLRHPGCSGTCQKQSLRLGALSEGRVVFYEGEDRFGLKKVLDSMGPVGSVALLVGPEGGFSDDETRLLEGLGASCFSLGRNVLRTETAALVAAAIILYELGEI